MSAPEELHELIERFDRNLDTYRSGRYNEAQVRQEFINPFFNALGWDVYNRQVYEWFLGKVIRLTSGNRPVVEDKHEVKKAGGVYYTPTYMVDYIVKQTVGKLIEGKKI